MSRKTLYWACQFFGWSLYVLLGIVLVVFSPGFKGLSAKMLLFQGIFVVMMITSTHLLRLYMKRKRWLALALPSLLVRLLPILLLISVVCQALLWLALVYVVKLYSMEQTRFSAYWTYVFYGYIILLLWSAIYVTIGLFRQRQQQEVDKWKLEAALKDTELQALKAQINPHFVFNSLNNIRSMIAEDQEQARHMVTHLSELLRYCLQHASQERVPLRLELELVQNYLKLESMQLEERLQYELHVSAEALEVLLPPMALQLLVENAIKHGISRLPKGGRVTVVAEVQDGQLQVKVSNTGQLTAEQQSHSLGIGFQNVSDRLRMLFGESDLNLLNSSADTVTASFRVPLHQTT
ncbi:MAG: histidine kinase [Hymenobacteraceae bacterium]|nr:histidine kinase [Hymenobacteraceae bacterium]